MLQRGFPLKSGRAVVGCDDPETQWFQREAQNIVKRRRGSRWRRLGADCDDCAGRVRPSATRSRTQGTQDPGAYAPSPVATSTAPADEKAAANRTRHLSAEARQTHGGRDQRERRRRERGRGPPEPRGAGRGPGDGLGRAERAYTRSVSDTRPKHINRAVARKDKTR